jgi:hypothetical protein
MLQVQENAMSVQAFGQASAPVREAPPAPTSARALSHIPGEDGWPILGCTLPLLADPKGFVERRAKRYGLVYRSRAFGQSNVSLLGPDANELFCSIRRRFFVRPRLGCHPRPAVSARADAA